LLKNLCGNANDLGFGSSKVITVGRSRSTGIKDLRLSRRHLRLERKSDDAAIISVRHIGNNRSVVNGKVTARGFTGFIRLNQTLELLEGKLKYRLVKLSAQDGRNKESEEKDSKQEYRSSEKGSNKVCDNKSEAMATSSSNKGHWSNGLVASMSNPEAVVFEDEELCVIKDKYPKAKVHLLVLPKDDRLNTLKSLDGGHAPLVRRMEAAGKKAVKKVFSSPTEIRIGFHIVPSMARLHLHVISQDFDSPCLKHKQHWNSFNTPYFVDVDDVIAQLEEKGRVNGVSSDVSNQWLKTELKCHKCNYKPKNFPDLKSHIKQLHFPSP